MKYLVPLKQSIPMRVKLNFCFNCFKLHFTSDIWPYLAWAWVSSAAPSDISDQASLSARSIQPSRLTKLLTNTVLKIYRKSAFLREGYYIICPLNKIQQDGSREILVGDDED